MSGRTRRGNMGPSLSRPDQRQATEMAVESDPNEVLPGLENTMRAMGIIDKLGPLLEPVKQEIAALRDSASTEACRKELEAVKSERDDLHRQLTKVEQKLNKYIESQTEDSQTIGNLREQVRRQKGDMQNLATSLELQKKETEDKLKENARLQDELSKNKSRLSRMMGQKLTDNNPDIADLSDANRPTKIAEKYKELYDNEYTDAYEEAVVVIKDEKEVASALQGVLKEAKNYCKQIAEEQTKHILEAVQKSMKGRWSTSYLSQTEDSGDLKKHVKDFRKNIADSVFDVICQNFVQGANMNYKLNRELRSIINDPKVEPFVKQCVHLCWLMVAQDPPVVIGEDPKYGDMFDANVYKAYTQTGPYVEYGVWPPLYLHDDGPLLAKGVAQGCGEQKERSLRKTRTGRQGEETSTVETTSSGSVIKEAQIPLTQSLAGRFDGIHTVYDKENSHEYKGGSPINLSNDNRSDGSLNEQAIIQVRQKDNFSNNSPLTSNGSWLQQQQQKKQQMREEQLQREDINKEENTSGLPSNFLSQAVSGTGSSSMYANSTAQIPQGAADFARSYSDVTTVGGQATEQLRVQLNKNMGHSGGGNYSAPKIPSGDDLSWYQYYFKLGGWNLTVQRLGEEKSWACYLYFQNLHQQKLYQK